MKYLLALVVSILAVTSFAGDGGVAVRRDSNLADLASTNAARTNIGAHISDNQTTGTLPDARLSINVEMTFTNIAQMLASTNTFRSVFVQGYRTPGDHGGGEFRFDGSSTATTNLGTIFRHATQLGRWLRVLRGDDVYVEEFGASASLADNSESINSALRWWIYDTGTARKGKIRFRTQSYSITNSPILIAKTNSAGNAFEQVFGLVLEADAPTPNRSTSAEIVQMNPALPAVIIQYGDSIEIKNLNLRGRNTFQGEGRVNTLAQRLQYTNYVSAVYAVRTNNYSPHAGLVTDCFSSDGTMVANAYPGLEAYYIGTSGGTAKVTIDHVSTADFYVGYLMNPNTAANVQQGDNFLFTQSMAGGCTYGWAIGQSESKAVTLYGCGTTFTMVGVTTKKFGQGLGCPPAIISGQYGFTKDWFDVALGRGRLVVQNVYTESLLSLGWIGNEFDGNNEPAAFIGCDIRFAAMTGVRANMMGFLSAVTFDSCSLASSGNTMNFANDITTDSARNSVLFRNCRILASGVDPRSAIVFTTDRNVRWEDSYVYDSSISFNAAQIREHVKTEDLGDYNRNFLPFGASIYVGTTNFFSGYDTANIAAGLGTFVFNGDGTGSMMASDVEHASLLRTNDVIVSLSSLTPIGVDGNGVGTASGPGHYVGRVKTITTNYITLQDVPMGWVNQNITSATVRSLRRFHEPTIGSITDGSYSITNVSAPTAWAVGDRIRTLTGLTEGTYITNITGSTFGISRAGTATTNAALYDANYILPGSIPVQVQAFNIIQPFSGITNTGPLYVGGASAFTNNVFFTNAASSASSNMTHISGSLFASTNGEKYATIASGKLNVSDGVNAPSGSGLALQNGGATTMVVDTFDVRPFSSGSIDFGRTTHRWNAGHFVTLNSDLLNGSGAGLSNHVHVIAGVGATISTNIGPPLSFTITFNGTNSAQITNVFLDSLSGFLNVLTNGEGNWSLSVDFTPQPASSVLSNLVAGASNIYVGAFTGNLVGGTNLPDAALSSNIPLKNAGNIFSGSGNSFPDLTIAPDGSANWTISRSVDDIRLSDSVGGKDFTFGADGTFSALSFAGNGGAMTYDSSGNNGTLSTAVNTLQELNDAIDALSVGGGLPGTNSVIAYGSAQRTNASGTFPGLDLVASNAVGSVTMSGGAVTATSYSGSGSALTGVTAANVTVVDGSDSTSFVGIFDSATGNLPVKTDTALTYNASSGALSATSFSGIGSALTAVNAATLTVVDGTDSTSFVGIFDSATGTLAAKTDAGLTYNASTAALTAGSFTGNGSGLTSVNSTTVTVVDGTDPTSFVLIADSATGSLPVKTDGSLIYNASSGALGAASLTASGNITGAVVLASSGFIGNLTDPGITNTASGETSFYDGDDGSKVGSLNNAGVLTLPRFIATGTPGFTGDGIGLTNVFGSMSALEASVGGPNILTATEMDTLSEREALFGEMVTAGTNGMTVTKEGNAYVVHFNGNPDYLTVGTLNASELYTTNVLYTGGGEASETSIVSATGALGGTTASLTNTTVYLQQYIVAGGTNVVVGWNDLVTVSGWSHSGSHTVILHPNDWIPLSYTSGASPQVVRRRFLSPQP